MAKSTEVCSYCNAKIPVQSFCPKCAQPTAHISARERIMWELSQWESSRPGGLEAPAPFVPETAAPAVAAHSNGASANSRATIEEIRNRPRRRRNVVAERTDRGATVQRLRRTGHDPGVTPQPVPRPAMRRPVSVPQAPAASVGAPPRPAQTFQPHQQPDRTALAGMAAAAPAAPPDLGAVRVQDPPRAPVLAPATIEERAPDPRHAQAPPQQDEEGPPFELVEGETLIHSITGWSRGRPASIFITRYRVALVRRPGRLQWIPLDQIEDARIGWRGVPSLTVTSSIELLTFQSLHRKALDTFSKRLEFEMRDALMPGGRRRHPEITQDWADRSTDVWDSHSGQVRLLLKRHPVSITLATLAATAAVNLVLR